MSAFAPREHVRKRGTPFRRSERRHCTGHDFSPPDWRDCRKYFCVYIVYIFLQVVVMVRVSVCRRRCRRRDFVYIYMVVYIRCLRQLPTSPVAAPVTPLPRVPSGCAHWTKISLHRGGRGVTQRGKGAFTFVSSASLCVPLR